MRLCLYLSLANRVSKTALQTAHSPYTINQCQTKLAPGPAENTGAWLITPTPNEQT